MKLIHILAAVALCLNACQAPPNKPTPAPDGVSRALGDVRHDDSTLIIYYEQGVRQQVLQAVARLGALVSHDYKNLGDIAIKVEPKRLAQV